MGKVLYNISWTYIDLKRLSGGKQSFGRKFVRPLHYLFGPFWVMWPNNRLVGNTVVILMVTDNHCLFWWGMRGLATCSTPPPPEKKDFDRRYHLAGWAAQAGGREHICKIMQKFLQVHLDPVSQVHLPDLLPEQESLHKSERGMFPATDVGGLKEIGR